VLAMAGFLTSCSGPPVSPTPTGGSQTPAPAPTPSAPSGYTLSGTVVDGVQPIPGGTIDYAVDSPTGIFEGHVAFNGDGRYAIPNLPLQRPVKITAWSTKITGLRAQQCAVNTIMLADAVLDIELVTPGTHRMTSPIVSGLVFETTVEGRRPVAGAWVTYYSLKGSRPDAYTETDANGRYEFCDIPLGTGIVGATLDCFNDSVLSTRVDVRGDAVVDVDLTSWIAGCRQRGQPFP
jgi:hypothetical protein